MCTSYGGFREIKQFVTKVKIRFRGVNGSRNVWKNPRERGGGEVNNSIFLPRLTARCKTRRRRVYRTAYERTMFIQRPKRTWKTRERFFSKVTGKYSKGSPRGILGACLFGFARDFFDADICHFWDRCGDREILSRKNREKKKERFTFFKMNFR